MKYQDARDLIKDGDLVFVRGSWHRPLQALIMWSTNSPYSHVGIAFWVEINDKPRLMMVEAQGGTKRRIMNMSFYETQNMDVVEAPKPWKEYADNATSKLGEVSYGWIDAVYVGLREKFQNIIYIPPKNIDKGEICSEFIAKQLGLKVTELSPNGLFRNIMAQGKRVKLNIRNKKGGE